MDASVDWTLLRSDVLLTVMLGEFEFGGSGLVIILFFLEWGFRCCHLSVASMFYLSISFWFSFGNLLFYILQYDNLLSPFTPFHALTFRFSCQPYMGNKI